MHAILIAEENLPKIEESGVLSVRSLHTIDMYMFNSKNWYLIRGYQGPDGYLRDWTVLPEYILDNFEYDADKIRTDWDQIVRK